METSNLVLISPREGLNGRERGLDLSPGAEPLGVLKCFDEFHDVDTQFRGKTAWPICTNGRGQFGRTAAKIHGLRITDKLSARLADKRQPFAIAPLSNTAMSTEGCRPQVQPGFDAADAPARWHTLEICRADVVAEVRHV